MSRDETIDLLTLEQLERAILWSEAQREHGYDTMSEVFPAMVALWRLHELRDAHESIGNKT